MVQNGVRVSTFSDNAGLMDLHTHLAHMGALPFPTRSRASSLGLRKRRAFAISRACVCAWAALLLACVVGCGPPSWPGGIRANMGASKRGLRVVELPRGSPAAKAGVQLDDVILEVDGRPVAGLPNPQIHRLLTGEVGSVVRLRIDRRGSLSEIAVTRAPYGK
jgi:hypothetical protein